MLVALCRYGKMKPKFEPRYIRDECEKVVQVKEWTTGDETLRGAMQS